MSGGSSRSLSHEERILWSRVARSVAPLPGKAADPEAVEAADFATLLDERPSDDRQIAVSAPSVGVAPPRADRQHRLDSTTRGKLAKGRLAIEGKVDLHGLTQSEAHALLLSFLHRAYADGRRYVLVVTGKGASLGSDGVLKRAVPAWLATLPFRALVSGHETASRGHGGAGALYVRLRRREAPAG